MVVVGIDGEQLNDDVVGAILWDTNAVGKSAPSLQDSVLFLVATCIP
jgi:hypothetical protein